MRTCGDSGVRLKRAVRSGATGSSLRLRRPSAASTGPTSQAENRTTGECTYGIPGHTVRRAIVRPQATRRCLCCLPLVFHGLAIRGQKMSADLRFCDICQGSIPQRGLAFERGERLYCEECWRALRTGDADARGGPSSNISEAHHGLSVDSRGSLTSGAFSNTPKPPPLPSEAIILAVGGQKKGPFTISQIQSMVISGSIVGSDLYWRDGMSQWASIAELVRGPSSAAQGPNRPVHTRVDYVPAQDVFVGTLPLMMRLAVRAVHEVGFKLENANDSVGMVTFRTGVTWGSWSGASCSLVIEEVSENTYRVSGSGKQNVQGGQLVALDLFGEAKSKANRVISMMRQLAGTSGDTILIS